MTIHEGRLRAPSYFVLASLLDGPRHGYVVLGAVEALSEGSVKLATGSLYAVLDRLNEAGLIEVASEETVNGRARRYYALTPDGRRAVEVEAARLASAATMVTDAARRTAAQTALGLAGTGSRSAARVSSDSAEESSGAVHQARNPPHAEPPPPALRLCGGLDLPGSI
jgi:PadR family transcriptional regulator PadR